MLSVDQILFRNNQLQSYQYYTLFLLCLFHAEFAIRITLFFFSILENYMINSEHLYLKIHTQS